MKLTKSFTMIAIHTAIGRILGLVRERIFVNWMGAGDSYDVYSLITKISSVFRRLFAEGAFNSAFVPIFTGLMHERGRDKALLFARKSLTVVILFLLPLTLLVEFCPNLIAKLLASGYQDEPHKHKLTLDLVQIVFPYITLITSAAIAGAVLNSLGRFGATAATQSIGNITILSGFFLFNSFAPTMAHSAAYGVLLSAVVQLLWLVFFAWREGFLLLPSLPKESLSTRKFLRKLLPGILGTGVVQINILINLKFASSLPSGGLGYVNLAEKVNQMPLSIIAVAMGLVLLPALSRQVMRGELDEARYTQNRAIDFANIISVPSMIYLVYFAKPIMQVLFIYEGGRFTIEDVNFAAPALVAFALGIPAYAYSKILSSAFFSQEKTLAPTIGAIGGVVANIVICRYSINVLAPEGVGHVGVAAASAASAWVNVVILACFSLKAGFLKLDASSYRNSVICLLIGGGLYILLRWVDFWLSGHVFIYPALYLLPLFLLFVLLVRGMVKVFNMKFV